MWRLYAGHRQLLDGFGDGRRRKPAVGPLIPAGDNSTGQRADNEAMAIVQRERRTL